MIFDSDICVEVRGKQIDYLSQMPTHLNIFMFNVTIYLSINTEIEFNSLFRVCMINVLKSCNA